MSDEEQSDERSGEENSGEMGNRRRGRGKGRSEEWSGEQSDEAPRSIKQLRSDLNNRKISKNRYQTIFIIFISLVFLMSGVLYYYNVYSAKKPRRVIRLDD